MVIFVFTFCRSEEVGRKDLKEKKWVKILIWRTPFRVLPTKPGTSQYVKRDKGEGDGEGKDRTRS